MSRESIGLASEVLQYLREHSVAETPEQRELRAYTAQMEKAAMQISAEQGSFMQLMAKLTNATRCIEVGVFTGYSALSVALALPDDGFITAFDVSEEWTSVARQFWDKAGVSHKVKLVIGPANDGLDALIEQDGAGQYDFAFIDADKENYRSYYEKCLCLLRPGGLMLIDNVLWSGKVADPTEQDEETRAIRSLNAFIAQDNRIMHSMVPISDGVTMVLKKD